MLCKYFEKILPENFDEIDLKKCVKKCGLIFTDVQSQKQSRIFQNLILAAAVFCLKELQIDGTAVSALVHCHSEKEEKRKK